jgi:hypothetical protein
MSDASLSVTTPSGSVHTFEANSKPLETTTAWINFDKSNDFSVPFQVPDGPKIFLRPDQVDAMRMSALGASRADQMAEAMGEGKKTSVSISVGGQTYNVNAQEIQSQLQGKGVLT